MIDTGKYVNTYILIFLYIPPFPFYILYQFCLFYLPDFNKFKYYLRIKLITGFICAWKMIARYFFNGFTGSQWYDYLLSFY